MQHSIQGVLDISLSALDTSPFEPKDRLKADEDLMASLSTVGLLEPIVVAQIRGKQGRFLICAGHRRFAAAKALGWATVPCALLAGDMDPLANDSLDLLLVENVARRDFDPVEEADLVARLLDRPGATREVVADALGRSVAWVSRRANLSTLSPNARDARGGVLDGWAASWLEELAILTPHQQDEVVDWFEKHEYSRPKDFEDLVGFLSQHLRTLQHAPWDLADEQLVPAVGSCSNCPKTSCAVPTLFGDVAGALDLKTAVCRDARCFDAKQAAHVHRGIEAAREEHGKDVPLVSEGYSSSDRDPGSQKSLSSHLWEPCSKKKGGRPAVLVDGPKAGKVIYMRPRKAPEEGRAPRKKPEAVATASVVRKLLETVQSATLETCLPDAPSNPDFMATRILDLLLQAREVRLRVNPRGELVTMGQKFNARHAAALLEDGWEILRNELVQIVRREQFENDRDRAREELLPVIDLVGFDWNVAMKRAREKAAPAKKPKARARRAAIGA